MGAIRINYEATIRKVNQLNELSNAMNNRCCNELKGLLADLPTHWRGEAATAYLIQCTELHQELQNAVVSIQQIAQAIKTAADEIKKADEAALLGI